jgi:uncharacterized protein YndB with AHSA1/START domain
MYQHTPMTGRNAMVREPIRRLGLVERDGQPAREVVAARTFDTDVKDLWDAVTNPDRIPRWFTPVAGDLTVGGQYQLTGNASGTVLECVPPESFSVTWEFGGEVSWVAVALSPAPDGGATLELRHTAHVPEEFWDRFGPGAVGIGWDLAFFGLGRHLVDPSAVPDPEEIAVWHTTDEGRTYITEAAEGWRAAEFACDGDAEQAKAAADRSRAFYLGETPA